MTVHLQREMEGLKKKMLTLCAVVEEALGKAVRSMFERDMALAEAVIRGDVEIDRMEVETEEECLKILALYQPVAIDLRFVVAILKINNDLERIADQAVNIAERSPNLLGHKKVAIHADLKQMVRKTQSMLKRSLDALVNLNPELARQVIDDDDEVDEINRRMFALVCDQIRRGPEPVEPLLAILSVSRQLERIADLVTNIAEDVIYMVKGEIVRHGSGKRENRPSAK